MLALFAAVTLGLAAPPAPASASDQPTRTWVQARQSATGVLTESYGWTLSESAEPVKQEVTVGQSGTVHWTITATRGAVPTTTAAIAGQVCAENTGRAPTQGLAITESVGIWWTQLVASPVDVGAKPVLEPGESWCYPYRVEIPGGAVEPGAWYWALGHVSTDNSPRGPLSAGDRVVPGPVPSGAVLSGPLLLDIVGLPAVPTMADAAVTVTDTNGRSFAFSGSGSTGYDQQVDCPVAGGAQTLDLSDTATITETGQSATAPATVSCMAPTNVTTRLSATTVATGVAVSDQATIGGAPAAADGSIAYEVYDNSSCSGTPVLDATPADADVTGGAAPASEQVSFATPGTYYWQVSYSGDPAHNTLSSESDCNSEPLTVTASPPCTHGTPGCPWQNGDIVSYTQVSWVDNPGASTLLSTNYGGVYAAVSDVFDVGTGGFSLSFGDAAHLIAFLPQAGTAGPLTQNQTDPGSSEAGLFGGDVAALKLDVDFADAGLLPGDVNVAFGDLHLCGLTGTPDLDGTTVRQLLGVADTWLGADTGPDSLSAIDALVQNVNIAFDGGVVTPFAQNHLSNGTCP